MSNPFLDSLHSRKTDEKIAIRSTLQAGRLSNYFIASVEYYMKKNDISKTELANKLDITPQAISRTLRRDQNLTIKTMAIIVEALGIKLNFLLDPDPLKDIKDSTCKMVQMKWAQNVQMIITSDHSQSYTYSNEYPISDRGEQRLALEASNS